MKKRKLLSIFLALALLLAGCASTTTIVEESPEASETAAESPAASEEAEPSESPAAGADPEASPGAGSEPGAGGEPGAGSAPGLGMENIVLGRVTDVTEGTVTLALLEPANLPEDAEASAETEEAAESAAPEFVFTVDALEEMGETAEYTLEELSAAVEEEAEIAEDAILQLTLDEDGAIASVRVLDAEA